MDRGGAGAMSPYLFLALVAQTVASAPGDPWSPERERQSIREGIAEARNLTNQMDLERYSAMGYVWQAAGSSVQYVVPGTDFRMLRLDCSRSGILITASVTTALPEGTTLTVRFPLAHGAVREGRIRGGTHPAIEVMLASDDLLVADLAAAARIELRADSLSAGIPVTVGAKAMLRELFAGCRPGTSRG
jgi:hypothetical protein